MSKCNCLYCNDGRHRRHENQHGFDGPEELPHRKKSKGSKANKFCKKKIGLEHDYSVTVIRNQGNTWRTIVKSCSRCHKQLWSSYKYQHLHEFTSPVTGEVYKSWI